MRLAYLWFFVTFLTARSKGDGEFQECQDALGMENSAISDGQITASSFYSHFLDHRPYLARLHLKQISSVRVGGWVAGSLDASQWLQIYSGDQYLNVTRVATQGRQSTDQKVTKYNLQFSNDGVAFTYYNNEQGNPKDFAGNTGNVNDVVTNELNPPIRARYIRFLPLTWHSHIAMRVELYGCIPENECQQVLGMANGAIPDEQISASSEHNSTTHSLRFSRLFYSLQSGAWVAKVSNASQWIQVDVGGKHIKVTRVATQGRANYPQWVTSYKLQQSYDGVNFKYYKESGQPEDKVFVGNTDQNTIKSHELNPSIWARYIRFRPVTWNGAVSMRVELYGCARECQDALGMENGAISDAQISASSEWSDRYAATKGRLNSHWCWIMNKKSDKDPWLKIDVLGMGRNYIRITRVATQGRPSSSTPRWVTKYKLQYSDDEINLQYYKQQGQTSPKV